MNLSTDKSSEFGKTIELKGIRNGFPIFYGTFNLNSAKTSSTNNIWPSGTANLFLTGATQTLGIWDAGAVLQTHQEFLPNRVSQIDGAPITHYHSTHVAGTMIATGVNTTAKGMAYEASLNAYDWNNDISEMATAAANGLQISNHSYGKLTGWTFAYNNLTQKWYWFGNPNISETEDYKFGFYDQDAKDYDQIAYNAPNYLIVRAAGNDRFEGLSGNSGHYVWSDDEGWVWTFGIVRGVDGGPNGYDCLEGAAVAKNVLTVGAVADIPNGYSDPNDVLLANFSSWGPVDDGRIKPDIVANGIDLYSAIDNHNSAYYLLSGTSMAAPSAAGSIALLAEHYENTHGQKPLASTLKALVIHTADEADNITGPDYRFGWGLLNTEKAANLISESSDLPHIQELTLTSGELINLSFKSNGNEPFRATICWTDPAGAPVSASLDPLNPMLVNDLDLKIWDSSFNTYYAYKLDPQNPANAPTTGINNVDNVEQVYIENPGNQDYTIWITHKGSLSGGTQTFSLITSGFASKTVTVDQLLSDGTTRVGDIVHWEKAIQNFQTHTPPKQFDFAINAQEVLMGTQEMYSNEKYHQWNDEPDVTNHHVFDIIEPVPDYLISRLLSSEAGVTIRNKFDELPTQEGGTIEFKDPWFIDYIDQEYNNVKRNRGMDDALFINRQSPFQPDYSTNFDENTYQGVFLNRTYTGNTPYYSINAEDFLQNTNGFDWYFNNWEATGAQLQIPNNLQTAVTFQQPNATVNALYNANMDTDNYRPNGTNSARKIVKDDAGTLHTVYQNEGKIYYTYSTDNGNIWSRDTEIFEGLTSEGYPMVNPVIEAVNGILTVVAVGEYPVPDDYNHDVYYATKPTSGGTWVDHHLITVNDFANTPQPVMSSWQNGSNYFVMLAYAVVDDGILTGSHIYTYYKNANATFFTNDQGSPNNNLPVPGDMPALSAYNDECIDMVYRDQGNLHLTRRFDDNSSWGKSPGTYTFTNNVGGTNHRNPSISTVHQPSSNFTYITWEMDPAPFIGESITTVIAYRRVYYPNPTGSLWRSGVTTFGGGNASHPSISIWSDANGINRPTIFYEKNNTVYKRIQWDDQNWSGQTVGSGRSPNVVDQGHSGTTSENAGTVYTTYNSAPYRIKADYILPFASGGNSFATGGVLLPLDSMRVYKEFSFSTVQDTNRLLTTAIKEAEFDTQPLTFDWSLRSQEITIPTNPASFSFRMTGQYHREVSDLNGATGIWELLFEETGGVSTTLATLQLGDLPPFNNNNAYTLPQSISLNTVAGQAGNLMFRFLDLPGIAQDIVEETGISSAATVFNPSGKSASKTTGEIALPKKFALAQNYPNPFNPTTTIKFDLPKDAAVSLKIYDINGRLVKTLVDKNMPAGYQQMVWNATNDFGQKTASGVYLYRLTAGNFVETKKMVLLR